MTCMAMPTPIFRRSNSVSWIAKGIERKRCGARRRVDQLMSRSGWQYKARKAFSLAAMKGIMERSTLYQTTSQWTAPVVTLFVLPAPIKRISR